MEEQGITLETLANGAALERFNYELGQVWANIMDINTRPDLVRNVQLKVSIKPDKDRKFGPVTIEATAKLAPMEGYVTQAHFGHDAHGRPTAVEHDPKQFQLFEEQTGDNVKVFKKGSDNA